MADITVTKTDRHRTTTWILDVREDIEVADNMIPGALPIPMGQVQTRISELDPAIPAITVCHSGYRSRRRRGPDQRRLHSHTMAGGMAAWMRAGLPTT